MDQPLTLFLSRVVLVHMFMLISLDSSLLSRARTRSPFIYLANSLSSPHSLNLGMTLVCHAATVSNSLYPTNVAIK